jgi:Transposase DDE domain
VVHRDGFPITHEVFAGNTRDHTTLATMLDRLSERAGLKKGATVVMDRGMAYDENIAELTKRNLHYVVASRQPERDRWPCSHIRTTASRPPSGTSGLRCFSSRQDRVFRLTLSLPRPDLVKLAKALARKKPKGGKLSLAISAELATQGFLNERGRPFQPQEHCGHARGANATRQRVLASRERRAVMSQRRPRVLDASEELDLYDGRPESTLSCRCRPWPLTSKSGGFRSFFVDNRNDRRVPKAEIIAHTRQSPHSWPLRDNAILAVVFGTEVQ